MSWVAFGVGVVAGILWMLVAVIAAAVFGGWWR